MLIKICGIIHPEDAEMASHLGADFIGLIFAHHSKRCLSVRDAKEIVKAVKNHRVVPVGVFVEHSLSEIISLCEQTDISVVQLHGEVAKTALGRLPSHYEVIYAMGVNVSGHVIEPRPDPLVHWMLYDTLAGGRGVPFDWEAFNPPIGELWILAGGLNTDNVQKAIERLRPGGVDVSSGVEKRGSLRKDPHLMEKFIQTVRLSR
jgi:phosphoribosylanthranilate isomerase